MEKINYNHHLSLIQTLPTSSTQSPPQTHTNDPISDSGCTGHYLDALTTIVHTREPSENPNQSKTPQLIHNGIHTPSPDPTKKLSSQAKHAEIFPNLHSSLISIEQLCDDECIVTFDKHKVIVIKTRISSLKAIRNKQMDYGDSLFIVKPRKKSAIRQR